MKSIDDVPGIVVTDPDLGLRRWSILALLGLAYDPVNPAIIMPVDKQYEEEGGRNGDVEEGHVKNRKEEYEADGGTYHHKYTDEAQ